MAARAQTPQTETNPISSSLWADFLDKYHESSYDSSDRVADRVADRQEADARCKRLAWLQKHEPEQVEERMEALGAASKEWVSHTVVECGLARSKSVRPLPIERDFVEAMVLLRGNPFLAEMFKQNSEFPPGRVRAMGPHAIQLGDTGDGGGVVLFNDKWATPEEAPTLRVCTIDMHDSDGYCLFPSFRDFLRSLVTVPLEGPIIWNCKGRLSGIARWKGRPLCIPYPEGTLGIPNLADAYSSFGPAKDGTLWAGLDFEADDDEAGVHDAKLAELRAGKRQLFDFLTKVWGVGPMSADEAKRWQPGLQAQFDSLTKLYKEENADIPHWHL